MSFFFVAVVLIEWVQAAHLQGKDDPDHQVWNQGYKSEYVVLMNEAALQVLCYDTYLCVTIHVQTWINKILLRSMWDNLKPGVLDGKRAGNMFPQT